MDNNRDTERSELEDLIVKNRRLLQNPYAYLGSDGNFEADPLIEMVAAPPTSEMHRNADYKYQALISNFAMRNSAKNCRQYRGVEINLIVKELQREFWLERQRLSPCNHSDDPIAF